ncbi:MAG: hypothetical protein WD599_01115, partial [Balneolaceae bacterium]
MIVVFITIASFSIQVQDLNTVQVSADTVVTATDTTSVSAPSDTTGIPQQSGQEEKDEEEVVVVPMWPNPDPPGFEVVETDSTLRWFMALDRTQRLAQIPGVIPYRTGSLGRPAGLDLYSSENRHQRVELYELSVNDPVTGLINWSRVPYYKISSVETADWGVFHRSSVQLREHYLVQPRTYLNFDESQENYRSLEFSFTHNIMARTNIEISYWDRKDGLKYPRSNMEGNQILARVRHHVTDKTMLKAGYISNSIDQEQPFGYNIPDLSTYLFNPFNATPLETSANSSQNMNDVYLQLHQRKDTVSSAHRMAGVFLQKDGWDMRYSQDTTRYAVNETGMQGWQEFTPGAGRIRASVRAGVLWDSARESLADHSWIRWSGNVTGEVPLANWIELYVTAGYEG